LGFKLLKKFSENNKGFKFYEISEKLIIMTFQNKVSEPQTIYSIRNGEINGIKIEQFSEFKEKEIQKILDKKKPRGIHKINISDSIAFRKAHPQNKLWYYHKKDNDEEKDINDESAIPTGESASETEEEPAQEEEKKEEEQEYINPESPRDNLERLPTLAEIMNKKVIIKRTVFYRQKNL